MSLTLKEALNGMINDGRFVLTKPERIFCFKEDRFHWWSVTDNGWRATHWIDDGYIFIEFVPDPSKSNDDYRLQNNLELAIKSRQFSTELLAKLFVDNELNRALINWYKEHFNDFAEALIKEFMARLDWMEAKRKVPNEESDEHHKYGE